MKCALCDGLLDLDCVCPNGCRAGIGRRPRLWWRLGETLAAALCLLLASAAVTLVMAGFFWGAAA